MKIHIRNICSIITTICILVISWIFPCENATAGYRFTALPHVSVSEEYSDNVFLAEEEPETEWTTIVSPGLTLSIASPLFQTDLSYDLGYSFYETYDENNSFRHNLNLTTSCRFSKQGSFTLTNHFRYTEDPMEKVETEETQIDIPVDEDTFVRKERKIYWDDTAGVTLDYSMTRYDRINARYSFRILENREETIADSRNSKSGMEWSHAVQKGLSWQIGCSWNDNSYSATPTQVKHDSRDLNPYIRFSWVSIPKWNLGADFSYQDGRYSEKEKDFQNWSGIARVGRQFTRHVQAGIQYAQTEMRFQDENRNYRIYSPAIGVQIKRKNHPPLLAQVGYFFQDSDSGQKNSGVTLRCDAGQQLSKNASFNISGSGGYTNSYFGSEELGLDFFYTGQGRLSFKLSKNSNGLISCSYRRDKYEETEENRKEKVFTGQLAIDWRPLKWFLLKTAYDYSNRDSNVEERSYEENRVFMSIDLSPGKPFSL